MKVSTARATELQRIDGAITRIARASNSRRAAQLRERRSGVMLAPPAVATLAAIYRHGPARLSVVAAHVGLEPSRISREVQRLVRDGLVVQRADPHDGRAVVLRATRAGAAAFRRYRRAADDLLAAALRDWTNEDLEALGPLLVKLADSLRAPLE
jgi:DNA-binding MarR family transcriptional regulator